MSYKGGARVLTLIIGRVQVERGGLSGIIRDYQGLSGSNRRDLGTWGLGDWGIGGCMSGIKKYFVLLGIVDRGFLGIGGLGD